MKGYYVLKRKTTKPNKTQTYAGLKTEDTFELIGKRWKILDINEKGFFCLCLNSVGCKSFVERDTTYSYIKRKNYNYNEWETSDLRHYLKLIYKQICKEIGSENVIEFNRSQLSLEGRRNYGTCKDKVSLISFDEYRKYSSIIPNFKKPWWTLTPIGNKDIDVTYWIAAINVRGEINNALHDFRYDIHPVCILSPKLFI